MAFIKPTLTAPKPVRPLPKLSTPNAADLVAKTKPAPAAQALVKPGMSSSEYIHTLEQSKQSSEAVKSLAHGMPERESVWYAAQSSKRVEGMMTPADRSAMKAAEAWAKNPNPTTHAQAAAAAAATDYRGPGAWAAQGAAWASTPGVPPPPAVPGIPAGSLTPHATTNSVMLASAMEAKAPFPPAVPPPPAVPTLEVPQAPTLAVPELAAPPPPTAPEMAKTAEIHQPYVDLGKDVAAGDNTWA